MTEKSRLSLKKKAADPTLSERLHKVLASSGVASRRSVEDRIARGEVQVNGTVAEVGAQVIAGDRLQIDGKQLLVKAVPGSYGRILIYNKPDGEVTSRNDPEGRPTVFEKLPKLRGARWISIGRLDINTQGLLIFTSNGDLAHRLSHPTQGFRREYVCRIHGDAPQEALDRLLAGVELEDGLARFDVLEPMDSAGGSNEWYRVEISEGRNREVRRLWEAVGFTVSRLKRTRFGPFSLPKGLNRGELAELSEEDVMAVCQEVGLPPPPATLVAEDDKARTLRRSRKGTEVVVAPTTGKKLKAERAYLGYLGGHITGEERPARGERHRPDDRFDPRGKRRGKGRPGPAGASLPGVRGRGKMGGKGGKGGRAAAPNLVMAGFDAQPTFNYDPLTGEFSSTPAAPAGKGREGSRDRRRGGGSGKTDRQKAVSALFRSEPSYRPPTYTSVIDPETGEVDGNRYVATPERILDDAQPSFERGPGGTRVPAGPGGGERSGDGKGRRGKRRRGGGRNAPAQGKRDPQQSSPQAHGPGAPAGPSDPAREGATGDGAPKRKRRFRRRRSGGGSGGGGQGGGGAQGGGAGSSNSPPAGEG